MWALEDFSDTPSPSEGAEHFKIAFESRQRRINQDGNNSFASFLELASPGQHINRVKIFLLSSFRCLFWFSFSVR